MAASVNPEARVYLPATQTTALALLLVAVALVASQWLLALNAGRWTHTSVATVGDVLPLVLLLGLPGLAAIMAVPALGRLAATTGMLLAVLGAGLAMRLAWYGAPSPLEDDFYRYMWDGAVVAAGHNPYALPPADAAAGKGLPSALLPLAAAGKDVLARINFPELTSIYPGAAQLAYALAYVIAPFKLDGLRLVLLAADAATVLALLAILKDLGRPPQLAALYWMNPLIVWASHATVHADALLPPLLLGACLLAWRGRDVVAALLLALAVGVKIWPVLLAPLLGRHILARGRPLSWPAIAFASASGLLLAPLAFSALAGMRSGLVAYSADWWNNNALISWIAWSTYHLFGESRLALKLLRLALAVGVGLVALHVARTAPPSLRDLLRAAMVIAAALFYLSPAAFPWYALWFLGLAAAVECRPLLAASATLAVYYVFFPLAAQGRAFTHSYYIAFLHALPVWAWLALEWHRRRVAVKPAA